MKTIVVLLVVCGIACVPACAQEKTAPPVVQAVQTDTAPVIDGVLDDACWQTSEKLTGFVDVEHKRAATQPTEVMICCDGRNVYAAFICHDSQPSLISAQQKRRDCGFGSDDSVTVTLDTLHNHLDSCSFSVNPIGTQGESGLTATADNITWRGDWHAAAKITADGWCAEMAIPFRMLRYPAKADTFGLSFSRNIPRLAESSVWPDLGPNYDMARYADLTGLELPKLRGRPVLMPYTLASRKPGESLTRVGLDFKEEFPNNVTALATLNPDFTDIQDNVTSIAFSHTERLIGEYRPFFREGQGYYPDLKAFYSRRINEIDGGVKAFGKVGKQTFAVLSAANPGEENHFASTYAYDISRDSGFAMFLTGSKTSGSFWSRCVSPGAFRRWRTDSGTTTLSYRQYFAANSASPSPEIGRSASAINASLSKSAAPRRLGYSVNYQSVDSDYYVRDAYVPTTGIRGLSGSLDYYDEPVSGHLQSWTASLSKSRTWNQGGGLHDESLYAGADFVTRHEWDLGADMSTGTWLGARDSVVSVWTGWLIRHLYQGGSASLTVGKQSDQDYMYYSASQSFKLTGKLRGSCSYEHSRLRGPDGYNLSQYTLGGNYDMTPERGFGVWMVGRGSKTNLCLTYNQTVRRGSDIYLIYGSPNAEETESRFAVKIVTPTAW